MARIIRNIVATLTLVLGVLAVAASVKSSGTTQPNNNIRIDDRCIGDLARFKFERIAKQSPFVWALAEVKPITSSGDIFEGMSIDEDGEVHGNLDLPTASLQEGLVQVISPLTDAPSPTTMAYTHASKRSRSGVEEMATFSPFLWPEGGLVILRYNGTSFFDLNRFYPTYLLPREWGKWVLPAWKFYQVNASRLTPTDADKNSVELIKLLDDENPLIGICACRALIVGKALEFYAVRGLFRQSDRVRQGIYTLLLLQNMKDLPAFQRDLIHGEGENAVHSPRSIEQLTGIALGVGVALYESPTNSPNPDALVFREWLRTEIKTLPKDTPGLDLLEKVMLHASFTK